MKRRSFVGLGVLATLALACGRAYGAVFGAPAPPPPVVPAATLVAWLDTLLPGDAYNPSASMLGLAERVILLAAGDAQRSREMSDGLQWLDMRARRLGATDFATLDEDRRAALAGEAEAAAMRTVAGRFFRLSLAAAMRAYYADARSWHGLGYDGPPQPAGFMDFALPPGEPGRGR